MRRIFYEYFDDDDLLRISHAIKEMEKSTSGEIVVSVKERRGFRFRNTDIRRMAEREFVRLRMTDTRDRTGILLFILLKEREFIILADSGIHSIVGDAPWENIRNMLLDHFKRGAYCAGVVQAVRDMGAVLSPHFPIKPDDTNEISNRVIIRP